jgi:hypothetical protein
MMRNGEEIQAAHDRLVAIVLGEVPSPFLAEESAQVAAALDALCWVLCHDHNPAFGEALVRTDAFLSERGYVLHKTDTRPTPSSEPQRTSNPEAAQTVEPNIKDPDSEGGEID